MAQLGGTRRPRRTDWARAQGERASRAPFGRIGSASGNSTWWGTARYRYTYHPYYAQCSTTVTYADLDPLSGDGHGWHMDVLCSVVRGQESRPGTPLFQPLSDQVLQRVANVIDRSRVATLINFARRTRRKNSRLLSGRSGARPIGCNNGELMPERARPSHMGATTQ